MTKELARIAARGRQKRVAAELEMAAFKGPQVSDTGQNLSRRVTGRKTAAKNEKKAKRAFKGKR